MRTILISLASLLVAFACGALAEPCPDGISPQTAQRLFDRVPMVGAGPGYRFGGIGTNKTEIIVRWSLDGTECPPISVKFEACTSPNVAPKLRLSVPPELLTECPGLQAVIDDLAEAIESERPAEEPRRPRPSLWPPIVIALGLAAVLWLRHRFTPKSSKGFGWGEVGQIVFALAATNPMFLRTPFVVTAELAIAWVILALALVDRDLLAAESRARKVALLGLFSISLLLRWTLSSWGPGDLHLNLADIWSTGLELQWGHAPIALFRMLDHLLGGIHDTHIIWCNLILSSLLPLLLYAITSELGVNRTAAMCAAFIVATHPLLIVFSGVVERQPTYLFAAFGSVLGLVTFLKRGRWRGFVAFVLGTVLATASRPEGAQLLVVHVAILLLAPGGRRARAVVSVTLAFIFPLAFAYVRNVLGVQPSNSLHPFENRFPLLWTILLDPNFTPAAWIVASILGLALGLRWRVAWIALVAVLGLDVTWRWTGVYDMFVGIDRHVATTRYQTILLLPFTIGVALLIEAVAATSWRARMSIAAAAIVLTAASAWQPYELLLKPFTIDYEYHFLRKHALTLPWGAHLYIFDSVVDDIGLFDAPLVVRFVNSGATFSNWRKRQCDQLLRAGSPTYLYIGSSCSELISTPRRPLPPYEYKQWLEDCASMRARLADQVVEEIEVPARKMAWHDFKERTTHLAIYELTDASLCEIGPRFGQR